MTLHTWSLFVAAVFGLSATPGPNMLHILARSVAVGLRRTTLAMAGCLCALLVLFSASAAGLTTLLMALPGSFTVLRYAGMAYLIYLGIKAWRSDDGAPVEGPSPDVRQTPLPSALPAAPSSSALFRGGFAIAISNPKALLFAAAFLPQFIDPAQPKAPQLAALIGTIMVVESAWYMVYALGGRSFSRHLARPAVKRAFNRFTGTVFIGFGLILFRTQPA